SRFEKAPAPAEIGRAVDQRLLSPERFAKMRDRAWSKIWQAEKRVVRSLAHLANRFHACGIERIPDPGRKSNVLNEGDVRKLWGRIEHRPRHCFPRRARLAQAFSICMERLLSL